MTTLSCDECGFDAARWSDEDLARTLGKTDILVGHVVAGADPAFVAGQRVDDEQGDERGDEQGDVDAVVATHELMHRLHQLAAARRANEAFAPMVGRVDSLQASGGGVPKAQVAVAEIGIGGLIGDAQGDRTHHGRPWQAVCLYSSDVLAALRAEGHPIGAGAAGENVTVAGIDWTRMRGGLTIAIGSVRLRTSAPATPCHKIADCFIDRELNRIHHGEHPGWARWYASVVTGGTIRPGDTVTVEA